VGWSRQVDDLLATVIHATGATQFVSARKVLSERVSNGFKASAHMAFNTDVFVSLHERSRLSGAAWHIKLGYAVFSACPCAQSSDRLVSANAHGDVEQAL